MGRSAEQTSKIMRSIRSRDTRPELEVRKLLRLIGIGYRLHRRELPGRPDLAFIGRKKVIFVHGCFWHQHADPHCPLKKASPPQSKYWDAKFARNKHRDDANLATLLQMGWSALVVWECETKSTETLRRRLEHFLVETDVGYNVGR